MSIDTERPAPIPELTSMRFIAALMVYVSHYQIPGANGTFARFLAAGYSGVTFFFILSGFMLAYNHLREFEVSVFRHTPSYLLSRVARVYPLYLFCIIFSWLAAGAPPNLLTYLALIQAWSANLYVAFGLDGPAWSVSVEAFLYLSFPAIVLLFSAAGIFSNSRRAGATAIMIIIAIFALAYAFMASGHGGSDQSSFDPHSAHRWLYRMPVTRLLDFSLGMLAATYVTRFHKSSRSTRRIWSLLTILSMVAVAWTMTSTFAFYTAWGWDAVYAIPFTIIIVGTATSKVPLLSKLLSNRTAILLGASSYAFYLIHVMMFPMRSNPANVTHPLLFYAMLLALTVSVSVGLHISIEEPSRRFLLSISKPLRRRAALAASGWRK
jgi:peptidoglycan/LPS O-acetylase OafA/YrhL